MEVEISKVETTGAKIDDGAVAGGGTTGIGVEACNKDGSKEEVMSKGVDEGKLEDIRLRESEEEIEEDGGNQREKIVVKGVVGSVEKEGKAKGNKDSLNKAKQEM